MLILPFTLVISIDPGGMIATPAKMVESFSMEPSKDM